jgi:hypothetical protein
MTSSEVRFACGDVDAQIAEYLSCIQVDPERMPAIRKAYKQDIQQFIGQSGQEARLLQRSLEQTKDRELNIWRAYTRHGMHNDVYVKLAQEVQAERESIENALQSVKHESSSHIENLDRALDILGHIGVQYPKLDLETQRELLRQLVNKVVIDMQGKSSSCSCCHPSSI